MLSNKINVMKVRYRQFGNFIYLFERMLSEEKTNYEDRVRIQTHIKINI